MKENPKQVALYCDGYLLVEMQGGLIQYTLAPGTDKQRAWAITTKCFDLIAEARKQEMEKE